MPLFYQHTINDGTRLGVWKIEEKESFFSQKVPIHRDISHPHKRLQHLAGRYLLQYLFPDFPYALIQIADTRKPFLAGEAYHFSISHCADYAAAIVSRESRVGVDIEEVRPLVGKISRKFLTLSEQEHLGVKERFTGTESFDPEEEAGRLERLTLCWTAKEALFKWYGHGALDFRKHMQINAIAPDDSNPREGRLFSTFYEDEPVALELPFRLWSGLVLAWVVT